MVRMASKWLAQYSGRHSSTPGYVQVAVLRAEWCLSQVWDIAALSGPVGPPLRGGPRMAGLERPSPSDGRTGNPPIPLIEAPSGSGPGAHLLQQPRRSPELTQGGCCRHTAAACDHGSRGAWALISPGQPVCDRRDHYGVGAGLPLWRRGWM